MGKCILLENDMFHTGLGLSKRKGSSVDRALIIDAFHRLGFQVFYQNVVFDTDPHGVVRDVNSAQNPSLPALIR